MNTDPRIQVMLGFVSLLSAGFSGAVTFYSPLKRSEQCRSISFQLGAIRREIDILMGFPPATVGLMRGALQKLNVRMAEVSRDAPTVDFGDEPYVHFCPAIPTGEEPDCFTPNFDSKPEM